MFLCTELFGNIVYSRLLLFFNIIPFYFSMFLKPVFNLAEYHQLFLGTERIRAPEIVFQPSLIGEDQAGIAETMQYVLER